MATHANTKCLVLDRFYFRWIRKNENSPAANSGSTKSNNVEIEKWSGRKDLNLRPPGPEPGALARLRYAPTDALSDNSERKT